MGISFWQLLIVFLIVVLVFGTKKLRNIGSDLGGAIKGFRSSMHDSAETAEKPSDAEPSGTVVEGEVKERDSA